MTEKLKKVGTETINRLNTETSPYFKPFKYVGGVMLIASACIKVIAIFTPAMPVVVISLGTDLLQIGLPLFGVSALTNNKNAATDKQGILNVIKKLFK